MEGMGKPSGLVRRGAIHYLRQRCPKRLQGPNSPAEISISLRTANYAEALERIDPMRLVIREMFAATVEHRPASVIRPTWAAPHRPSDQHLPHLTDELAARLARQFFARAIRGLDANPIRASELDPEQADYFQREMDNRDAALWGGSDRDDPTLGNYPLATCRRLWHTIPMSKKAPTLRQFQDRFPTEDACLNHLFQVRYGTDFGCPGCGRPAKFSRVKTRRSYQCQWCAHQVYPTAGTPFDRTRTPLRDWFFVMFQFCASRNGVAAKEVERQLGVTYKTAWRMCHQIREYMGAVDGNGPIGGEGGVVELDETFIGGRHARGQRGGDPAEGKTIVFGMKERGGEIITHVVPNRTRSTIFPLVRGKVEARTEIHTDDYRTYITVGHMAGMAYTHLTVNHSVKEYVSPQGATVNSIEAFWAQLKRGINGTHIHVSGHHLPKYLAEFEYRHNMRHLPHLMLDRLMVSFAR